MTGNRIGLAALDMAAAMGLTDTGGKPHVRKPVKTHYDLARRVKLDTILTPGASAISFP